MKIVGVGELLPRSYSCNNAAYRPWISMEIHESAEAPSMSVPTRSLHFPNRFRRYPVQRMRYS
jgi:hypothetical protein